jgi:hypothetical protein
VLGEEVVGAGGVAVEEERVGTAGGGTWRGGGSGLGFCFRLGSGFVLWLCDFGRHLGNRRLRIRMR